MKHTKPSRRSPNSAGLRLTGSPRINDQGVGDSQTWKLACPSLAVRLPRDAGWTGNRPPTASRWRWDRSRRPLRPPARRGGGESARGRRDRRDLVPPGCNGAESGLMDGRHPARISPRARRGVTFCKMSALLWIPVGVSTTGPRSRGIFSRYHGDFCTGVPPETAFAVGGSYYSRCMGLLPAVLKARPQNSPAA
jgi:hypothetical protein